jgi:hypothetical protein
MKKATVNIVKDLVALLTFTEEILNCSVNANEVTLTVCDTHGLVNKGYIEIGGVPVQVIRIINSDTIVIAGTQCPIETEIVIPPPFYFHGTLKATDSELSQITSGNQKTPMVYLFEVLQERRNRNPMIKLGRRVDLTLFFLEDDIYKGDLTEDRYEDYIDPMTNLAEDFVTLLIESPIIGDIEEDEYIIIPHAKAGFYDKLGHVKNLFSMELSGVELRISLPVNKNGCIDCKN